jgi:tetratricopeptide (TPR) repeat protein
MEYRKLIILLALPFLLLTARAQEKKVVLADSTAEQLYNAGDWKQLIILGNKAIADSGDFSTLRFKLGYAYMLTGNYKAAINQFDVVLSKEPTNSTARLYQYYCNVYLNNNAGAAFHAGYLDKGALHTINVSPFGLVTADLEGSIKLPNNNERDNGFFERIGLSNRLGWRFQLDQSYISFDQKIFREFYRDRYGDRFLVGRTDKQKEYFARLQFTINDKLSAIGSYHYIYTTFRGKIDNSNLGLLGIIYTGQYVNLQGDVNWGNLIGKTLKQYDAKLDFYPLGNLNLYALSRASVLDLSGVKNFIYSEAIGFKLLDKTWTETSATFGNEDDYLDNDGLYVYNSIDPTKFKCGETVFYQLTKQALLRLNYIYEKKTDIYRSVNYNQNSVTLGITWKF